MDAPLPVIPLQYAHPSQFPKRRWLWIAWWSALLAWPVCLVAWLLIFVHTETVLLSSPLILLLGILAIVGGIVHRAWRMIIVGACHCSICLLFVILVNVQNWSPTTAHRPFLVMGAFHLALMIIPTFIAIWPTLDTRTLTPIMPPNDLSPNLRLLYEFELSLGNAMLRIDRTMWSACPLAVIFRDPLHFDAAIERLNIPAETSRWENRDTHYALEAGWQCNQTRHTLAGPIALPPEVPLTNRQPPKTTDDHVD